ncbi:hypothetical protein TcYC6_0087200 [Trypanosoma cruzi]|nr:hypothetical protein TcYC6_0087200 [Trypanosoma cruzi]
MDDGIPRLANTLPQRKKAAFALRKAYWPALTSLCETLLAIAPTWLDIRRGIVRAAERHTPCGSRDSPKTMWTHGMVQAEVVAEAACKAHTASPGGSLPELKLSANGRTAIIPFAVFSPCCQRSVRKILVPSRAQACDAPRHGSATSPPSEIGCAVLLGPRLCSVSAAGNPLVRHTVRVALAAVPTVFCTPCACVPPGDWNMDWSFMPYALELATYDALRGVAPSAY